MHRKRPGANNDLINDFPYSVHAKARARGEEIKRLGIIRKEENLALIYLAILSHVPKAKNLRLPEAWLRQYTLAHETVTVLFRKGVCTQRGR